MGFLLSENGASLRDLEEKNERRERELKELVLQRELSLGLIQERLAELELAADEEGWIRLTHEGEREFSRGGLSKIVRLARLMYLKNPLIRRAISVQTYYVFGQGVSISGPTDEANDLLQDWLSDRGNQATLTGHQAMVQREVDLQTDGNLFFPLFVDKNSGRVQIRVIQVDEIQEIITNPDDNAEPWFYRREWEQRVFDPQTGSTKLERRKAFYPDWRYQPEGGFPATMGGISVEEDIPLMHVKVGGLGSMRFGVPDVYAALDWARAYKDFLEDWASLVRALQRWAWALQGKGNQLADAKTKLGSTLGDESEEGNPPPTVGSVALIPDDMSLAPIPKTGAQVSADDSRALRTMVAAATDIPDTILAGDPDMGNLATAKTLDRPTELAMRDRQTLWTEVFRDLARFVIEASVRAPNGRLNSLGTIKPESDAAAERITLSSKTEEGQQEDVEADADIAFPPILEQDVEALVRAIVQAATLGGNESLQTIPMETISRMLLSALGEQDVDARIEEMKAEKEEEEAKAEEMRQKIASGQAPPPPPPPGQEVPPAEEQEALFVEALNELRRHLKLSHERG